MFKRLESVGFAAAAFLGMLGLLAYSSAVDGQWKEPQVSPTITLKTEFLVIYATQRLIDFARTEPKFETMSELKTLLKAAGLEDTWYGMVSRDILDDGTRRLRRDFCRMDEQSYMIHRNRDLIAFLAGKTPDYPTLTYEKANIVVIPEESMHQDPFEVLKEFEG